MQQEVSEWRDTMPDWHHHCQVGYLARTRLRTGRGQGMGGWRELPRDRAAVGGGVAIWSAGKRVSLRLRQITGAQTTPSLAGPQVSDSILKDWSMALDPRILWILGLCPQSAETCLELQVSSLACPLCSRSS